MAIDHLGNAQEEPGDRPASELMAFAELPNAYGKLSNVNIDAVEKRGVPIADYFGPLLERFGAN